MKTRAEGYYWVKYDHNYWLIAEWDGKHWLTTGSGVLSRTDSDFDEIDERRIEREPTVLIKQAFDAGTNYATYNGRPGSPDAPAFDEWYKKWKK